MWIDIGFNQTHNFKVWRSRIYNCLRFFFSIDSSLLTERIEVIVPLTEVEITSGIEGVYTIIDDTLISIDKTIITEPTNISFSITYKGFTSSCSINIVE